MAERIHPPAQDIDREVEPLRPDASLGELLSELTDEFGQLVRKEIELARVETTEEIAKARRAAISGAIAGVAGLLALIMLSDSLARLLNEWMDDALAWAIVGVVWAIVAAVLLTNAKKQMQDLRGLPETKTTLKEDVEWARAQRS
jgi:uncharacterized membrane protein YqjE